MPWRTFFFVDLKWSIHQSEAGGHIRVSLCPSGGVLFSPKDQKWLRGLFSWEGSFSGGATKPQGQQSVGLQKLPNPSFFHFSFPPSALKYCEKDYLTRRNFFLEEERVIIPQRCRMVLEFSPEVVPAVTQSVGWSYWNGKQLPVTGLIQLVSADSNLSSTITLALFFYFTQCRGAAVQCSEVFSSCFSIRFSRVHKP